MIQNKLKGMIPAIITPLTQQRVLDHNALHRIINNIMENGGNGIMVLGSTGEGPIHETEVAIDLIQTAVDYVGNRGVVVVGTTAITYNQSIYLADAAWEAGAAAVLNIPPFYFNLDEEETICYYTRYADRSRVPVIIYHMPDVSRHMTSFQTIKTLSNHENIVGIKDSSGNFPFFQGLTAAFEADENFSVFMGKALLILSALVVGADGTMTPAGNLIPQLEREIYTLLLEGDISKARAVQSKIFRIFQAINKNGKDLGTNIKGILNVQGIAQRYTPDYIDPLDEIEAQRLNSLVNTILNE